MTEKDYPNCEYCGKPMTILFSDWQFYWTCQNKECGKYNQYLMDPQPDKK